MSGPDCSTRSDFIPENLTARIRCASSGLHVDNQAGNLCTEIGESCPNLCCRRYVICDIVIARTGDRRGKFMNKGIVLAGLTAALLISVIERPRAEDKDKDPLAVVALGVAGDWGFPGGKLSRGPSAAVEFNVIKD